MYEYRYKNKKTLTYQKLENQLEKRKKIKLNEIKNSRRKISYKDVIKK